MRGWPGRVQLTLLCSLEQPCGRLAWCGRLPSWQRWLAGMLLGAQGPRAQPLPATALCWGVVARWQFHQQSLVAGQREEKLPELAGWQVAGSGDPSSRLVCPAVTCHCPGAHGCCPCPLCPPGPQAQPQPFLGVFAPNQTSYYWKKLPRDPPSLPKVSFGGGMSCFFTPRCLPPPWHRQRIALETSYRWQGLEHWHLQVMLPSAADEEDPTGVHNSSSQAPVLSTQGRACASLWAGPACAQREADEGFKASGRVKGCREVGPSRRLSWSIPGAQAGLGLAARTGTGPAAIQLTTVLSHRVKSWLREAIDKMHGGCQIQAAKLKVVVGTFSSTHGCADDPLLVQGQVLGVQVG